MGYMKKPAIVAAASLIALTACGPAYQQGGDRQNQGIEIDEAPQSEADQPQVQEKAANDEENQRIAGGTVVEVHPHERIAVHANGLDEATAYLIHCWPFSRNAAGHRA